MIEFFKNKPWQASFSNFTVLLFIVPCTSGKVINAFDLGSTCLPSSTPSHFNRELVECESSGMPIKKSLYFPFNKFNFVQQKNLSWKEFPS